MIIISILKNRFTHYILLFIIVFFLYNKWQNQIEETRRNLNNVEVLLAEKDSVRSKIKAMQITSEEFKNYYLKKEDSLLKELKIKPKHLLSIQYIKISNKGKDTSNIKKDTVIINDTTKIIHKSFKKIGCSIISFTWNNIDPTGTFNYDLITDIKIIEHVERRRLFDKKWLPKWGRKEVFISLVDNCNDSKLIENRKIELSERKEKLWKKRK